MWETLQTFVAEVSQLPEVTGVGIQTAQGLGVIGALVWGVNKMSRLFEAMQSANQLRTDAMLANMQTMMGDYRAKESARTDAHIAQVAAHLSILTDLVKSHTSVVEQAIKSQASARELVHDLRNLKMTEDQRRYESQKEPSHG